MEEALEHDPEALHRRVPRRSTGGSTRTGASTTRTASTPRRTSRSSTSTGPSRSSSARARRTARGVVLMRPAPVSGPGRPPLARRPGARRRSGPRLNEAGVTLVIHGGDSELRPPTSSSGALVGEIEAFRIAGAQARCSSASPIHDTMASLIADGLFERLPEPAGRHDRDRLGLGAAAAQEAAERPRPDARRVRRPTRVELFRDHVWVSPFYEDDLAELVEHDRRRPRAVRLRLPPRRGPRRSLDVDDTPAEAALRAEARAWLDTVAVPRG